MILVVALLGILFVAGAAFLQSVTFQARVVTADREQREVTGVLDAVDALVFEQLTRSWLDGNGAPYVPQPLRDDADIQDAFGNTDLHWDETLEVVRPTRPNRPWETLLPTYGEAQGLHPILSTTEPIDNLSLRTIPTDLNRVLRRYEQPSAENLLHWSTPIGQARTNWLGAANYIEFMMPPPVNLFDADGDGVVDSVEVVLDASNPIAAEAGGLIPPAQQLAVVEQLRASDAPLDDNRLRLSLRVISHGSMVNATCTHPLLLNNVVNDFIDPPWQAAAFNVGTYLWYAPGSYRPEIEERALRYRNILPARSLAASALQTELYGSRIAPNPVALYAHSPTGGIGGTLASHRWWPFAPHEADQIGMPYGVLFDAEPTFAMSYNVADAMAYDRRHLLTTVSYDDLLIRGVRFPRHSALGNKSGRDIVEWMRSSDMRGQPVFRYRDNYPDTLTGGSLAEEYTPPGVVGDAIDPRVGRLQLSIPYLDQFLLDKGGAGTTIDNYSTQLSPQDRAHFVGMIYDTFWLMLWNHPDLNGNGTYDPWEYNGAAPDTTTDDWERARLAASLTANFIDFADSNDEPTYIQLLGNGGEMIDANGDNVADYGVIGVERQPYITEVYTKVVDDGATNAASSSVFAIELYNPYSIPLTLDGYSLIDETTDPLDDYAAADGSPLVRLNTPLALDGKTIPAGGFMVFHGYGAAPTSGSGTPEELGSDIAFDHESVLTLQRTVTIGSDSYTFAVDRLEDKSAATAYTRTPSGDPPDYSLGQMGYEVSLQRDTYGITTSPPNLGWRFVVPWLTHLERDEGSGSGDLHTLGQSNENNPDTVNHTIRPVQVDFANTGSLTTAYPTTGALLLLMRLAHEYDASQSPVVSTPYNHMPSLRPLRPGEPDLGLGADYDQIDNGRMPVFDVGNRSASLAGSEPYYHTAPSSASSIGKAQGVRALPWGQFVFDYFTALPLERTAWNVQLDYQQPNVDQGGLRVHGRININTAPYKVLAGLPLRRLVDFPSGFQAKLAAAYSRNGQYDMSQAVLQYSPMRIGPEVARAIVAYREAREVPNGCSAGSGGSTCSFDFAERARDLTSSGVTRTDYVAGLRQGRGFLSVGELANVRHIGGNGNTAYPETRFDHGVVGRGVSAGIPAEDYVEAVALLVGLEEWVTNRSHVFTIYGTLRGPDNGTAASVAEADAKAIRFEQTVNRLPTFFDSRAPFDRIGERFVGKYEEARAD